MKLISIFTFDPSNPPPRNSPQLQASMISLIGELMTSGKMLDTGGVSPTGLSVRVERAGNTYNVTDGPFSESKELVGGFAVFDVDSKDEAVMLTQRFLDLVGSGTCELHEVDETPIPAL